MLYKGKFHPYLLIIQKEVGRFDVWPINQYFDAVKEEVQGKGAAVYAVYSLPNHNELVELLGPVWQIIRDGLERIPLVEFQELGVRSGFCYKTSFNELAEHWEGVPNWRDLLHLETA
jgi:hypothetical protein